MASLSAQHQAIADFLSEYATSLAQDASQQLPKQPTAVAGLALLTELESYCQPLADALLMNSVSLLKAHLEHLRHDPGPSAERDEQLR